MCWHGVTIDMYKLDKRKKFYGVIALVLLVLVGWALFFHFYPVDELVNDIGIENTYFAAFMLAVIGGFSSITGTSLYAALVALAHGGVNPLALGVIGGLGLFISDSLFYFVITKVRHILVDITKKWERVFRKIWKLLYITPSWIVYVMIFLYTAFIPFPNDIVLALLAVSGYSYRQFAIFLLLGDLTMALLLTNVSNAV